MKEKYLVFEMIELANGMGQRVEQKHYFDTQQSADSWIDEFTAINTIPSKYVEYIGVV